MTEWIRWLPSGWGSSVGWRVHCCSLRLLQHETLQGIIPFSHPVLEGDLINCMRLGTALWHGSFAQNKRKIESWRKVQHGSTAEWLPADPDSCGSTAVWNMVVPALPAGPQGRVRHRSELPNNNTIQYGSYCKKNSMFLLRTSFLVFSFLCSYLLSVL